MNLDKLYDKAMDWIITMGPRILAALLVLLVGLWMIRLLKRWTRTRIQKRAISSTLAPFLQSLVISLLYVLLVLLLMQILGIQMTLFAAIIGGVTVAAGLALSGTMQNFASGILILLLKPFRIGDNIVTQGQEGTVTAIQIFYTVITTFDNKIVIVPNSKLSNEIIINTSREGKRRMDIELKLNYGIDIGKVRFIIEGIVQDDKDILNQPEPRVGVSSLDSDGYKVMVNAWVKPHGFHDERMGLQEKIIDGIKRAGIKLPGMA
ncbi:mechanosensitive ion channel family protein [Paraflavitalea sp. CAU 1676]|uniref:mechanosensitive ion channel family protein n=1 Tax=Paraflavitalea sp. CAU 1676 TaxID=3032598 RepID=UPI0023DB4E2D|nr:mechanosensitive ion channel family protein [Paraflavitalea sp. CAU 1676]MDF2187256.1 mechanosensitive ion channel family protein [Paraflavitalea sp. CAU 1676]